MGVGGTGFEVVYDRDKETGQWSYAKEKIGGELVL